MPVSLLQPSRIAENANSRLSDVGRIGRASFRGHVGSLTCRFGTCFPASVSAAAVVHQDMGHTSKVVAELHMLVVFAENAKSSHATRGVEVEVPEGLRAWIRALKRAGSPMSTGCPALA